MIHWTWHVQYLIASIIFSTWSTDKSSLSFRSFLRMSSSYSFVIYHIDRYEKHLSAMDYEDNYKQLYSSYQSDYSNLDWISVKCLFNNRFRFYLILILIFTSQTESFPLLSQGKSLPFPWSILSSNFRSPGRFQPSTMSTLLTSDFSRQWLNAPIQSVQSGYINSFRRERHRRVMIDRLMILFDEDGESLSVIRLTLIENNV